MGSCISKCMPGGNRPTFDGDYDFVQDELVISQAPAPFKPPTPLSTKISTSLPPPESSYSKSTTSSSFFTASNSSSNSSSNVGSTSSCSSLSTASSGLSSKDRSTFSNDFLLSCIKENPHVLRINSSIKASNYVLPSPDRIHVRGRESPTRQSVPQKGLCLPAGPAMQKRVRSSSPSLTRQKSMRVTNPEGLPYSQSLPSRVLRSPSPSRRFEGTTREMIGNRRSVPSTEEANSVSSILPSTGRKKEHSRPASPNNSTTNTNRLRERVMSTRENIAHQIGAKVEEITSKFSSPHNIDSADDINNPLISLDCFIFL